MSTIEEIQTVAKDVVSALNSVNLKLDEIKAFIEGLQGNPAVTQEQLDAVMATLTSAKEEATSVLAEADALDETK